MAPTQKGGNGRQKIAIRRIEKEGARQVCFSKRRQGLFIKATELAVMCGAEVAVVAFSPGGKAFSFGHPSAEAIIDRFLAGGGVGVLSAADDTKLKKLHLRHGELRTQLKEVKERKECVVEAMAKERAAGDQIAVWLNPDLGDMGEEEMKAFAAELMVVREAISERTNQVLLEVQNTRRMLQAPAPPLQQLFGGSTFEFGSSSSTNAGMEMQQMQMAMPPMQGFVAGMDMHHMLTSMPLPPGLDYGMDMQQIPMSIPLSSGFGAGMEKQQMVMAMSPMQGFTAGMDMQDMLMAMSPTSGLAYEMDMQQILMSTPSSSGYGAGMEMQQMQMAMSPQPEFTVGTEMQQIIMAMSPPAEFSAGMEMSPPIGIAAGTEMVQLGPGPNMGFPY